jgi:hypothetical protein
VARDISDRLARTLKAVDRPGTFCTDGSGPAPLPGLEVAGLGPVGLPLTAAQVPELVKQCRQAPYGKGEETLVDTSVRRVWQLDPDRFSLTNPDWEQYLATTVQAVQRELGLKQQKLESHLYNLLLYEPGSFFLPHRDGEKLDRMVATLVIVLPSSFEGGELVVRHEGQERVIDFGGTDRNPFHAHFAAFYADCEHEVRPLREGYRLCLVYNLTLAKAKKAIAAPRTAERIDAVADVLCSWSADDPLKLAVLLEHKYTPDGLVWDALKGVDREKARVLNEAAERAGCSAYLALLTLHESGSAEEEYVPRRGRRWDCDDDENDPENYEMSEVFDSSLTAEHWSDAAGHRSQFGVMEVEPEEVVPSEALTKGNPEVDVSGYTGNEGLTMDRWYRHAAIILWPVANQFDVLCDCGTTGAVAALGEWVARWQKVRGKDADALKAQCLEFANTIIDRWGGSGYQREVGSNFLALVLRIDDAQLLGNFLTDVAARDPSVELDAPLAKAFDAHGWDTSQSALTAVIGGTAAETLGRNVRLLDRLCSAGARPKGERLTVCRLLTEKVVGALERIDREDIATNWRLRDVNRAEVLTGLIRALVATEEFELLSRFVSRALADPKTYPLSAHIAALTALGPWLKKYLKKPCEPVSRWLAACCTQLESLTASEPTAPTDFRREANVRCDCADCKELKAFLKDPTEKVHRFRVRQDRRQHLEHQIRERGCDADCVTDRTGSPQTLVCTKNTASFDARQKKFREDLTHLAALRSIGKRLQREPHFVTPDSS